MVHPTEAGWLSSAAEQWAQQLSVSACFFNRFENVVQRPVTLPLRWLKGRRHQFEKLLHRTDIKVAIEKEVTQRWHLGFNEHAIEVDAASAKWSGLNGDAILGIEP